MLIKCVKCNVKNEVIEIQELEDIANFSERLLIIGVCRACNSKLVSLVEIRNSDKKVFIDSFAGIEATNVIKRERKRLKNKNLNHKYNGFVYGKNKEIRNKKGEVTQIRQYASDYKTGKKTLIKTLIFSNI